MPKRRKEGTVQELETAGEDVHVSPAERTKKAKKRKRVDPEREAVEEDPPSVVEDTSENGLEGKKPKRKKKREKERERDDVVADDTSKTEEQGSSAASGRRFTVSMALPGSIVDNAQTLELKTYLAGQVARAAAIFSVDEIIIFNEQGKPGKGQGSDPNVFLARLLEYQETPQYLRKALFPMHRDLKYAGLLNPLDCPHHMRADELCPYREGVITDTQSSGEGSIVDCGMKQNVVIDKELEVGTRVTVKLNHNPHKKSGKVVRGEAVSPSVPRTVGGLYWGYTVRLAHTFSAVFTDGPHQGGYDLTIGTSERGESVDGLTSLPPFQHLLVVFGGLKGLEHSLECDQTLKVGDVSLLFHHYLNTCPNQRSRTIRTEEAILISLGALRPLIVTNQHKQ